MGRGLDNQAVAVINETISREVKVTNGWTADYGSSPERARSITFDRFGVGGHKRAEYDKFCAPSGMLRPGVDALPHHCGLQQNRSLLRANIAQHNQAMSVPTVPQRQYDQQRDTSYLCTSPSEITAKSHDFMYKIPNRLFDGTRYLPSRERRARAARRGTDTCQLAPVHKKRGVHSLKGTDQLSHTRNAMADELAVIEKELMQMDQPPGSQTTLGATVGGVFYPGRSASAPPMADEFGSFTWNRCGPFGELDRGMPAFRKLDKQRSPFAIPDRNAITWKANNLGGIELPPMLAAAAARSCARGKDRRAEC